MRLLSFNRDSDGPFALGRGMLLIEDTAARANASAAVLRQIWRLTPAEAEVALSIAAGADLDASADRLGIGKETVRTQLRAIFAKTGTRRQTELIALLGRLHPTRP